MIELENFILIWRNKMVGNGSGKYDYEPNKLDTDIQAILDKRKKFENDLRNLIFQEPFLVKERYKQAIEILIDIKKKYKF